MGTILVPGGTLVPFERMTIDESLSGKNGTNRSFASIISAEDDYQAVKAYLYKFRGQPKTMRSYQKEIERFLLWCITERGKAMSSVLADDCEAYKDFLNAIPDRWIGVRRPRHSRYWKPFAGPLNQKSKRYAVQVLRSFFDWLVKVQYLAANPWAAVSDPPVAVAIKPIMIEKAFPAALWTKLSSLGGILDQLAEQGPQERLARAAILMLGETGLRREEIAFASRKNLRPHPTISGIWRLDVLGKRGKWRSVYLSPRTIEALAMHWQDRGEDFSLSDDRPLMAPVNTPPFPQVISKHSAEDVWHGFSVDGVYKLVTRTLREIARNDAYDLTADERARLLKAGVHALRHTFGTLALSKGMPLHVVQKILGHASLNTTTIYVQTEEEIAAKEATKVF